MEMWCAARHCAFESHPLRQVRERRSFSGAFILSSAEGVVIIFVSLLFGFAAWALEAAAILVRRRRTKTFFVGGGFFSCCISALCPLFMMLSEVNAGDTAAVEDEIGGFIFGVVIMMGVTLVLTFIALVRLSR